MPSERWIARHLPRCLRKKPYPDTDQGRAAAERAARAIALKDLRRGIVHRMHVYRCTYDPTHLHVGTRGAPFPVGSQGTLDAAGWARSMGLDPNDL